MRLTHAGQRLAMKAGLLTHRVGPMPAGAGPRVLLRVDEFPRAGAFDDPDSVAAFAAFDALLAEHGVPYLLAVTPRVADRPLDPAGGRDRALDDAERAVLAGLPRERVTFAAHGLTHRTRRERPRERSEFAGLDDAALRALLDQAEAALAEVGIAPRVYVAPFNRFTAAQYAVLAERYDVVCGGPESVPQIGLHASPSRRGGALYLPSHPPAYGSATEMAPGLGRLLERADGRWLPITVHWDWERADETPLRRLLERIAPHAVPWTALLEAAAR